jgi:hypothetical protein
MGITLLRDVLMNWSQYELEDEIYVRNEMSDPSLDMEANVLPFDPARKRTFEGQKYFLGIEQVRDVIEGLEAQLRRPATPLERLRATVYYAQHDAFIDPAAAVGG